MKYQNVLNHFGIKITDTSSKDNDFYIYEESTADGYPVYVATEDPNNININDDVYYYDGDLSTAFVDAVVEFKHKNFYIDDIAADWLEEAITELDDIISWQN